MISYCIAVYRPWYARRLIADLIRKTTAPFELLLWLNVADADLEQYLAEIQAAGHPLQVVGRTPHNIGMAGLPRLFSQSRYELITQIDDDVICVSPNIAQIASAVFSQFSRVKQLVADVWQDEFTTGARPDWSHYHVVDAKQGLYSGPIDGWFSVYHRSILGLLTSRPIGQYYCLGCAVKTQLERRGWLGLLCTRFKVFHVIGPDYASLFGALDFEIAKYRRLGRHDIATWYEQAKPRLASRETLQANLARIEATLA